MPQKKFTILLLALLSALMLNLTACSHAGSNRQAQNHPPEESSTAEETQHPEAATGAEHVFWTPDTRVYHTDPDCEELQKSEYITAGSVEEAIAAGRTRLCYSCAQQDQIAASDAD